MDGLVLGTVSRSLVEDQAYLIELLPAIGLWLQNCPIKPRTRQTLAHPPFKVLAPRPR